MEELIIDSCPCSTGSSQLILTQHESSNMAAISTDTCIFHEDHESQ